MQIEDIIDEREEQDAVWVAHPKSRTFQVLMRPLAGRHEAWADAARVIEWDEALIERRLRVDPKKYAALFAAGCIAGWKGLDFATLKKLVLIRNPRQVKRRMGAAGLDFTPAAAVMLLLHGDDFYAWAQRTARNVDLFNGEREKASEGN